MTGIRLQLFLSKAGVASRRHAEELITAGQVTVNGQVAKVLGTRVDPVRDRVAVGGREVQPEAPVYVLLNKPKGYVTTAEDPEGRPTVFALLGETRARLFSVGRLDFNTEGALLLTNDGELAFRLMHPSHGVEKVYHAKFRGSVSREQIAQLRAGVDLPPPRAVEPKEGAWPKPRAQPPAYQPERSAPCEVAVVKETGQHTWLELVLHEGKNRQLHRMAEAVGSSLLKLLRVQYASLNIDGLPPGQHRELSATEVARLRQDAGLSDRATTPGTPRTPEGRRPPADREAPRARPPRDERGPAPRWRSHAGPAPGPRREPENDRPRQRPPVRSGDAARPRRDPRPERGAPGAPRPSDRSGGGGGGAGPRPRGPRRSS